MAILVSEHLLHLQRRDGPKDRLGIDELLLREQLVERRGVGPGWGPEVWC